MAGDITWTAPAIKKTARTNRALTAANEMLYQGMTMAAQANPQDREIANKYRDAWVKQLGVNGVDAIRLSDAYNNRDLDPDGVNEIVKELGGVKSKRFAQVMKKAEELNRLMGQ
jgi:alkylation response protein AidB-like acyl-CoA dehydrogenase